jgi:hypothetical protein
MFIPGQVTMIPAYVMFAKLGLVNTPPLCHPSYSKYHVDIMKHDVSDLVRTRLIADFHDIPP